MRHSFFTGHFFLQSLKYLTKYMYCLFNKNTIFTHKNNLSKMYPEKPPSRSQASDSLGAGPRHLAFGGSSKAAGLACRTGGQPLRVDGGQPGYCGALGKGASIREDSGKTWP